MHAPEIMKIFRLKMQGADFGPFPWLKVFGLYPAKDIVAIAI